MSKISASQIKRYSTCPRSYWYRYISEKEPTKIDKGYLSLGSRVHEAIEGALNTAQDFDDRLILQARIQNRYKGLSEYELSDDLYEQGMDCCETATKFLCKRNPDIRDIEKRVEFDIDETGVSTGVSGYIDLTTETELWDWKTGSIRDDTEHDEKIQGSVYMAAYYVAYGEKPEKIRFVYLKEDSVRSLDPSDENWEYMVENARELLKGRKNDEYPTEPGGFCYLCGYEAWCDASPVGMGGVPYEQY